MEIFEDVGVTRSLAFSPSLQRNICLALVDRKYTEKGINLGLEHPDGILDMAVTELPFVDKEGSRVRA